MLRAVMGYETDVVPLATGLPGYIDSEEGLGVVMERGRKGKYIEAGQNLYLAASLAYFEHKDFRDTFEVIWRTQALKTYKAEDITNKEIDAARNNAYNAYMRIFRGTDDIPWFKDLQYHNGAKTIWRDLDAICGDDVALQLMLMGKTNVTSKSHMRTVLESKTS